MARQVKQGAARKKEEPSTAHPVTQAEEEGNEYSKPAVIVPSRAELNYIRLISQVICNGCGIDTHGNALTTFGDSGESREMIMNLGLYNKFTSRIDPKDDASVLTALFDFMEEFLRVSPFLTDNYEFVKGLLGETNLMLSSFESLSEIVDGFSDTPAFAQALTELITLVCPEHLLTDHKKCFAASRKKPAKGPKKSPKSFAAKFFGQKRYLKLNEEQRQYLIEREEMFEGLDDAVSGMNEAGLDISVVFNPIVVAVRSIIARYLEIPDFDDSIPCVNTFYGVIEHDEDVIDQHASFMIDNAGKLDLFDVVDDLDDDDEQIQMLKSLPDSPKTAKAKGKLPESAVSSQTPKFASEGISFQRNTDSGSRSSPQKSVFKGKRTLEGENFRTEFFQPRSTGKSPRGSGYRNEATDSRSDVSPVRKRRVIEFRNAITRKAISDEEIAVDGDPLLTDEDFYPRRVYEQLAREGVVKNSAGRGHGSWTGEQVAKLEKAMLIYGAKWSKIAHHYQFQLGSRNQVSIKDKARNEFKRRVRLNLELGVFGNFFNVPMEQIIMNNEQQQHL